MTITVGITEFRNNIFKYADMIKAGHEVEVEREGERIFEARKPAKDDIVMRSKRALAAMKRLKGVWKDYSPDDKFFNSDLDRKRIARLGEW